LYSFASKYCHFHRPRFYPIYDKLALRVLKKANGRSKRNNWLGIPTADFNIKEKGTYKKYKGYVKAINNLNRQVGVGFSYSQIDHYLLLTGQAMAKQNHGNNIVKRYFLEHQDEKNRLIAGL
jgi:hypothetical protein